MRSISFGLGTRWPWRIFTRLSLKARQILNFVIDDKPKAHSFPTGDLLISVNPWHVTLATSHSICDGSLCDQERSWHRRALTIVFNAEIAVNTVVVCTEACER
jgi:hypothetical protein